MLWQEIWAQRLRLRRRSRHSEYGHRRRTWNQAWRVSSCYVQEDTIIRCRLMVHFMQVKEKKNFYMYWIKKPQLRDQTKNEPHIWNASDFIQQFLSSVDLTSRPSSNCACFLDRQSPHRPTNNPNASKFAQKAAGSDVCPRCGKTVYAAEKVIGAGNVRVTCVYSYLRLETQTCQFAVYSPPLCSLSLVLA